jgi:hypothetical protein
MTKQADGAFGIEFFEKTDDAIEFPLENLDRVFLFIQDSSRYSDRLSSWAALRPAERPVLARTTAGSFYTYVIDAFTPESGVVFAGYGYSETETNFTVQWGEKDERILFRDKYQLVRVYEDEERGNNSVRPTAISAAPSSAKAAAVSSIHCEEDHSRKASFWGEHRKIRSVLGAPADMAQHRTG